MKVEYSPLFLQAGFPTQPLQPLYPQLSCASICSSTIPQHSTPIHTLSQHTTAHPNTHNPLLCYGPLFKSVLPYNSRFFFGPAIPKTTDPSLGTHNRTFNSSDQIRKFQHRYNALLGPWQTIRKNSTVTFTTGATSSGEERNEDGLNYPDPQTSRTSHILPDSSREAFTVQVQPSSANAPLFCSEPSSPHSSGAGHSRIKVANK